MPDVVILTLRRDSHGCMCGAEQGAEGGCGGDDRPRVPVLACADALRGHGLSVELVTAGDDSELDAALKTPGRLVVAAATDAELRAVVRRLVRRNAPPPSKRPADLPGNRTMFDLDPMAVLPLAPAVPELVTTLGLPRTPEQVAQAVVGERTHRYDLLRTDSGSATLGGALVGGVSEGVVKAWRGRVEVDDTVLSDGEEPIIACAVRNAGSSEVDGLPLLLDATPDDGRVEVAVAVPVMKRRLLRQADVEYEVRRARGRAVSVVPRGTDVRFVDDGVAGTLTHKRSWWTEAGAWAAYVM